MFGKQQVSGEFFKPKDEDPGNVYVLEAKGFEAELPTKFGPMDTGYAVIHAFAEGKGEPEVRNVTIQNAALARAVRGAIDGPPLLVKLEQVQTKKGFPAWVFQDQDPEDYPEIVAYFEKKEADEEPPAF